MNETYRKNDDNRVTLLPYAYRDVQSSCHAGELGAAHAASAVLDPMPSSRLAAWKHALAIFREFHFQESHTAST